MFVNPTLVLGMSALLGLASASGPVCDGSSSINTIDILNLAVSTNGNSFSPSESDPFSLEANHHHSFSQGTAQICIEDDFLFENTHVALASAAQGALSIVQQCCGNNATTCAGGHTNVGGDDGLSTILTIIPSTSACKGKLQFDTTGVGAIGADIAGGLDDVGEALKLAATEIFGTSSDDKRKRDQAVRTSLSERRSVSWNA